MNEALMMDDVAQQAPLKNACLNGQDDLLEIEVYNVEECNKTVRVKSMRHRRRPRRTHPAEKPLPELPGLFRRYP